MIVVATPMRSRRGHEIVAPMSNTEPLRMCIAVDRGAAPVRGRVIADRGAERAFTGWTELFAALEAVIADDNENGGARAQDL
jgi:hypothetical protein